MNKLNSFFLRISNLIGFDLEILWSSYNQLWSVLRGPLTIFFIVNYLDLETQGLWYTFINLGALKTFAELGFATIITQFVSHESAHLKISRTNDLIEGEPEFKNRLISLIHFSLRIYSYLIPLSIIILIGVGYFYFEEYNLNIFLAWCCYSVLGGMTLYFSLFQSIYKGIDRVKAVQKNILAGGILFGISTWLLLFLGFSIWSLIIATLLSLIIMIFQLYRSSDFFWNQVFVKLELPKIDWKTQILGLQWRYAISWGCGYFIFNLIVPVLYKQEGAELAGQYGLTYSVLMASVGLSQAWIVTKIPKFNFQVSRKNIKGLNYLFKRSLIQALLIQIFISLVLVLLFYILKYFTAYGERFLIPDHILILFLIQLPIQIVNYLAIYLRAFKKEPLLLYSIISATFVALSCFLILPNFGFEKMLYFLLIIYYVVLLPFALVVFLKFKNKIQNG